MSKHKKQRLKDTLGKCSGAKTVFLSLPEKERKIFFDECKYLGVREGDEIAYRTLIRPSLKADIPLDLRKELIEKEKSWFKTEQEFRRILAAKDSSAEKREIAARCLEDMAIAYDIWVLVGARRAKDGFDFENLLSPN